MSRRHSGNYQAKHPADAHVDSAIMDRVAQDMSQGSITCQAAHGIAKALGVPPEQVGMAIDLQNGRITACQLGLFGYGKIKKIADTVNDPQVEIATDIQKGLVQGRLPCATAWAIADKHNIQRIEIGRACEKLGIKIVQCQLGAF